MEAELLADNPLTRIKRKAPEQVAEEVDPECVPNLSRQPSCSQPCGTRAPVAAVS